MPGRQNQGRMASRLRGCKTREATTPRHNKKTSHLHPHAPHPSPDASLAAPTATAGPAGQDAAWRLVARPSSRHPLWRPPL
eukprot:scaffold17475_cov100-Isochrysis_galbana.AAC.4